MSIVALQLGQCGNQVGEEFFKMICKEVAVVDNAKSHKDFQEIAMNCFFKSKEESIHCGQVKHTARAIMVDMEPKVIHQTQLNAEKSGLFEYDSSMKYYKQSGSANNWAYGFNVHGPTSYFETGSNIYSVCDIVRKEIEQCDCFGGFLLMSSLAGGTGSGLGAFMTQQLRDDYETTFLVNQVVWPYSTGEVIVQNYNTLLTLSTLHENSDAVIVFDNDILNQTCIKLLNIKRPSFRDMNHAIATALSNILLPSYHTSFTNTNSGMQLHKGNLLQLWADPLKMLSCHPGYKILTTKVIPQIATNSMEYSSFTWQGLLKHLAQMLISDSKLEESINWNIKFPDVTNSRGIRDRSGYMHINRSIANLLILRGSELNIVTPDIIERIRHPIAYARCTLPEDRLMLATHGKNFNGFNKSVVLLSNSQSIVIPLDRILYKASEMFHAKAYLHQYAKYDLSSEDFIGHFRNMEQVLFNYRSI